MSDLAYASTLLPCQVRQTCLQYDRPAVCNQAYLLISNTRQTLSLGAVVLGPLTVSASWVTCPCTGGHPRTLLAWVNGLEARWVWQEGKIGASTTCWPRAKRPMQFLSWLFGGGNGSPKEPEKSEDEAPVVSKAATQPIKGSTTGTIVRYDDEQDRVSLLMGLSARFDCARKADHAAHRASWSRVCSEHL